MSKKVYSGIQSLPKGHASDHITPGCICLEGGAFRGLYGEGVLDALMEADINFECTVGVSAGTLNALNYVSGQIGRSARLNLNFRNDDRYVGIRALLRSHSIIGFDFMFETMFETEPFDHEAFNNPKRRVLAGCLNCNTGKTEFIERGKTKCDFYEVVRASSSMPFLSRMVDVDGTPYLDGGCEIRIPYQWAIDNGYEKVVVIRTRHDDYRKPIHHPVVGWIEKRCYRKFPKVGETIAAMNQLYNEHCDEMLRLREEGRIFIISPSQPILIGRLEKDLDVLGDLYYMGYHDAQNCIPALKEYLAK